MKRQTLVFTLAAVLLTATLWAAKIRTDWDHNANFDDYQTYMWKGGNALPNPLMEQRVISAIESELSAKGIQKVEADPDMYVTYHASSKEDTQYQTDSFGYGMGGGWRWGGMGGTSTTRAYTYTKGTIVVDLWDAQKRQLLWRGSATDTVSDKPEKNTKKVHKAIEKLFKKYPPKKK